MTSPTTPHTPPTPTPYATAAGQYLRAGWNGPLPLPPRRKANPPDGYTGQDGRWPDDDTIAEWTGTHADGNIGLRLPQGVIGLDVDAYTGKMGGHTIRQLEALLSPLPPTWRVTSRDDGISGIRLYHVPAGLKWPGQVTSPTGTSHVEVIQTRHRYAVVWPSIHPDTGSTYRWISPSGLDYLGAPNIEDVEHLPDAWVTYLTGGDAEIHRQTAGLTLTAASSWLHQRADGPACRETTAALTNAALHLGPGHDTGSRHEAALAAVMRLTHLAGDGHTGTGPALKTVKLLFDAALNRGHQRAQDDGEWTRMLAGAIDLAAAATPAHRPADPCTDPTLGGLIDPETTWTTSPPNPATTTTTDPTAGTASSPTPDGAPSPAATATPTALSTSPDRPAPTDDGERIDPETIRIGLLTQNALDNERARREARRILDDAEAESTWRDPRRVLDTPGVWTLADELQLPDADVTYRVADVYPTGTNVLLTAAFKAGKTTLVDHLTASLVDSRPFLGRHDVLPLEAGRRVALWNYEVSRDMYRRWLRDVRITPEGAAMVAPLNLRGLSMPLLTPRGQDWAVKWLIEHDVQVWVLDPFARAFTGAGGQNENDNGEVGRLLDTLDIIKDRAGVGELILPTHTGRSEQEPGRERARGATRLDDWCDVRWLLTVGTGGPDGDGDDAGIRYFRATGRDVDTPEVALTYDDETRQLHAVHDGPARTVAGRQAGKRQQNRLAVEMAVSACIQAHTGCSYRAILTYLDNAGLPKTRGPVDAALEQLTRRGKIRVDGGAGNGSGKSHVWLGDAGGLTEPT